MYVVLRIYTVVLRGFYQCLRTRMCVYICVGGVFVCMNACVSACMCICVYECVFVCMYANDCVCVAYFLSAYVYVYD